MSNRNDVLDENNGADEPTFNCQEFAVRIKVSLRTLFTLRQKGLVTFSQSGTRGQIFFTKQDEIDYKNSLRRNRRAKNNPGSAENN